MNDALVVVDAEGAIRLVNHAATNLFGIREDDMLGRQIDRLITDLLFSNLREHVRQGKKQPYEYHYRHPERDALVINMSASEMTDESGKLLAIILIARDITEKKRTEDLLGMAFDEMEMRVEERTADLVKVNEDLRTEIHERTAAERALREALTRLQALIENMQQGLLFEDEVRRVRFSNRRFCELFGIPEPETILGADCSAMAGQAKAYFSDPEGFVEMIEKRLAEGKLVLDEELTLTDSRIFERDYIPVVLDHEQKGSYWVYRDITKRKLAEEKILQSEEFIRGIFDTVDEGFIVIDRGYRIVTANKAYCAQAGKTCEEIIGKHCFEVSHNRNRPCYEEGIECSVREVFKTGAPSTVSHRHIDADGNARFEDSKVYPIKDASGNVVSVIETINNVTEKHLLAEERLKTQKLESIGTLAGGIAHDFNNLLQGIFGFITLAKISYDQREKSLAMLEQAEDSLHRAVTLTTQLLTFAKGGKPVKKLMGLMPVIEDAVKFALSGSHTDYRMDVAADLWPVEADEGQLARVIQNIVLNADEAMGGRGTVKVALENALIPKRVIMGLPEGGRFVRIAIQDSGTGIAQRDLPKIFDPYFTTKPKGNGLGLATSYSIIRNHGGAVEVKSELSKGAVFTVYLPAASGAIEEKETPVRATDAGKKGRVLFMDDEEFIRNVAAKMISALGHEVETASDGKAAIGMFSHAMESGRPFDIVILDLTVKGGMGGEETISRLLKIDPSILAVVSSGYAESTILSNFRGHGFSAALNKPYRIEALRDCLNSLLK